MDIVESVIFGLTSDEVRRFKILSNRFKADEEKKLLILFDAIRSEKYADDDKALVVDLYGENNAKTRNRYYRLRNKLLDNIEKSLVFYHFKYKDSIHAYYDIQLSIMFRERGSYRLALYFLKKAEKKAKALDQFNILEQIYEEYAQLAIKDIEIDIEKKLEERKENLRKVELLRKNTEAIAVITQKLKSSNFSRGKASVIELLDKTRQKVEESAPIFNSPEGKIQLFRTVTALLLQKEAHPQLVDYLDQTIAEFEANQLFNNDTHETRLLMRLWLIISLFKVYKFARAGAELLTFEKEMKLFNKQNYFTYLFNYYNIKINLLKANGDAKGVEKIIRAALDQKEIRSRGDNVCYLLRSLADHQFNSQRFQDAVSTIARLKAESSYEKLNQEVRLFIEIFEMINHFEAGDHAFMENNFKEFKRSFRALLKQEENAPTKRFLEILQRMNTAAVEGRKVSLRAALKGYKEMTSESEYGDNHIIMYDLYLQSRLEGRPYYELFLENTRRRAKR
ncbi:MAG: hypothetical protein AAGN35_05215 [Bacteroidota bacterium]